MISVLASLVLAATIPAAEPIKVMTGLLSQYSKANLPKDRTWDYSEALDGSAQISNNGTIMMSVAKASPNDTERKIKIRTSMSGESFRDSLSKLPIGDCSFCWFENDPGHGFGAGTDGWLSDKHADIYESINNRSAGDIPISDDDARDRKFLVEYWARLLLTESVNATAASKSDYTTLDAWAASAGVKVARDPNKWLATLTKNGHSVRIALATEEFLDAPTPLTIKNPILSRNLVWWVDAKEFNEDLPLWANG